MIVALIAGVYPLLDNIMSNSDNPTIDSSDTSYIIRLSTGNIGLFF